MPQTQSIYPLECEYEFTKFTIRLPALASLNVKLSRSNAVHQKLPKKIPVKWELSKHFMHFHSKTYQYQTTYHIIYETAKIDLLQYR